MGEFPNSSMPDAESLVEEKRPSNPPPMKSSRDGPESMYHFCASWITVGLSCVLALKSVGVKVPRLPGALGSGESDYDSGDEAKRRKSYRGDHDVTRRYVSMGGHKLSMATGMCGMSL